ncbi:hypothetical protein POJ06DRAFT_32994 [Lipomyces tetrasporus]|uniref:Secreted protein n=1 Tax=Lipomyces tetrasporus TaxID=54092 RepID=A0AAD7QLX1_9ASCO|nr:uncharacterized protein POJ06DRAFT_32994 [Lipomyces tetrasporus]KAJ8097488.1 hypothetical protein POJ06DRAFT_32994 [Lipomyces tetrasporus]
MHLKASTRSRLTTSLFSTTFIIAVLTVAAPAILPCPATRNPVGADSGDIKVENRKLVVARRDRVMQQQQQERQEGSYEDGKR